MRAIGVVSNEQDAQRLGCHLLTQGIATQIESSKEGFCVWVRDEDKMGQARREFDAFLANPSDPRYDAALTAAEKIRSQKTKAEREYRKNVREMRNRWSRPQPSSCPLTISLMALSLLVAATSRLGSEYEPVLKHLFITKFIGAGLPEVRDGQLWRLVTPIFIHHGVLHLVFNLWWLYSLGGIIERARGAWRFAMLVLVTAVISNLAQFLWAGPGFGGMSGVLYALLGYAWMKSRYDPTAGIYVQPDTVVMMIAWLFICMSGHVGDIANAAHVAGLISGTVVGLGPVLWRKLLK